MSVELSVDAPSPVPGELHPLEAILGYVFRAPEWLERALTHTSAIGEGDLRSAQRLEFLGDAVVSLVLSEALVQRYPDIDEGRLSRYRASLVRGESFAAMAESIGLGAHLRLGKGELNSGGRSKRSILADAYEALLGAVFLDGGYAEAQKVVLAHFAADLESVAERGRRDAKTELQERLHREVGATPVYRVVEECGPAHAREFVVEVVLGDRVLARGRGPSKRAAAQEAASLALDSTDAEVEES